MATTGVYSSTLDVATYKSVCNLDLLSASSMFERATGTRWLTISFLDGRYEWSLTHSFW